MGDNAQANWEWKNTVVGEGYQARGVIRQRTAQTTAPIKVTNLSAPLPVPPAIFPMPPPQHSGKSGDDHKKRYYEADDNDDGDGDKKRKKEKDSKKSKKEHRKKDHRDSSSKSKSKSKSEISSEKVEKDEFNPILQCLAQRLSNKTRLFTLEND